MKRILATVVVCAFLLTGCSPAPMDGSWNAYGHGHDGVWIRFKVSQDGTRVTDFRCESDRGIGLLENVLPVEIEKGEFYWYEQFALDDGTKLTNWVKGEFTSENTVEGTCEIEWGIKDGGLNYTQTLMGDSVQQFSGEWVAE